MDRDCTRVLSRRARRRPSTHPARRRARRRSRLGRFGGCGVVAARLRARVDSTTSPETTSGLPAVSPTTVYVPRRREQSRAENPPRRRRQRCNTLVRFAPTRMTQGARELVSRGPAVDAFPRRVARRPALVSPGLRRDGSECLERLRGGAWFWARSTAPPEPCGVAWRLLWRGRARRHARATSARRRRRRRGPRSSSTPSSRSRRARVVGRRRAEAPSVESIEGRAETPRGGVDEFVDRRVDALEPNGPEAGPRRPRARDRRTRVRRRAKGRRSGDASVETGGSSSVERRDRGSGAEGRRPSDDPPPSA